MSNLLGHLSVGLGPRARSDEPALIVRERRCKLAVSKTAAAFALRRCRHVLRIVHLKAHTSLLRLAECPTRRHRHACDAMLLVWIGPESAAVVFETCWAWWERRYRKWTLLLDVRALPARTTAFGAARWRWRRWGQGWCRCRRRRRRQRRDQVAVHDDLGGVVVAVDRDVGTRPASSEDT